MLCLSLMIGFSAYAQNKFEKGYYINNDGTKIEGLIKNNDWSNNPINFKFQNVANAQVFTKNVTNVKEFYVGGAKFIKSEVEIDRSSNRLSELSYKRTPEFKKETLFLRVLVEGGSASLYSYTDSNLRRYFYNISNKKIVQLIYKSYKTESGRTGKNELYKKQLKDFLPCSSIKKSPSYAKNNLTKYFISFNNCNGNDNNSIDYTTKETKGKFKLKLKGGINYSKVSITALSSPFGIISSESDSKINPRVGLELEYLLPLNNNRWSVFIEPTYISFNGTAFGKPFGSGFIASPDYNVDYKSIELPIGIRYYFPIKNNSNVFLNGGFALDLPMDSTVASLEIKTDINIFLGFGYMFKEKYGLEVRYNSGRGILTNYVSFDSSYSGLSLNFGYTLF